MAYDYSSESKALELPNPYRVENLLVFLAAAVLVAGGLAGLLWARSGVEQRLVASVVPLLAGVGLLAAGITAAAWAASRLRFFFGRDLPASLAIDLRPGVNGSSAAAERVKALVRQGGITYPEPQGALNGVLYHWVPRLITAPLPVQQQAQAQFFNLLAVSVTLLSFVCAWGLFGTELSRPLLSVLYGIFGLYFLLRPLFSRHQVAMGQFTLVALVAMAIVGPVLAALVAPALPLRWTWSMHVQTFVMLLTSLVAVALAMRAALSQVGEPPPTQVSCEQHTVAMHAPPAALLDELERHLQSRWQDKMPNRRYARLVPEVDLSQRAGAFAGELVEETQPLPVAGTAAPTLGSALGNPRHRWLALLDAWALLLVVAATACTLVFIRQFVAQDGDGPRFVTLGVALILLMVATFSVRAAQTMWGRFDFESVLTWVEMVGSWQAARVGTGNQLSTRLNSESDVVRTESMTLRVWRARLESVTFGKPQTEALTPDAPGYRWVSAMFSAAQDTQELARRLTDFAGAQALLITPESAEDQRRMGLFSQGEAALTAGAPATAAGAAALHEALRTQAQLQSPQAPRRFCSACGANAAADARFCAACGTALNPPA
jgi:hypothetical protein